MNQGSELAGITQMPERVQLEGINTSKGMQLKDKNQECKQQSSQTVSAGHLHAGVWRGSVRGVGEVQSHKSDSKNRAFLEQEIFPALQW